MPSLDDPKERILRLFEMEDREGRGSDCQRFEAGIRPPGVPIDEDELVYGIYKRKYFFTPRSFIQQSADGFVRVRWRDVKSCSTQHGEGAHLADLVLVNGSTVQVRVGDFAKGWSGRISQLFHQLIEKHGAPASLGRPLYSIEEFFGTSNDPPEFLPNLDPPLTLEQARDALDKLARLPGVREILLDVSEFDGDVPIANGVVVCGDVSRDSLLDFVAEYGADGVLEASDDIRRKVGTILDKERILHVVWD
jgi:hypothetical protein